MAIGTLALADGALKDDYIGPIIEQMNYKCWMLDKIERDSTSVDYTGRRWVSPVHSARNRQRGSIVDAGNLPTPGFETVVDAIDKIKYHAWALSLSDAVIRQATGDNAGAFTNWLDFNTKALANNARKDMNRQFFGDGLGTMASVVTGGNGVTTVTLDSVQYLEIGDPIEFDTRSNGTVVSGSHTITDVNKTTKVITISPATSANVTNTEGVYLQGSYGNESPGLRNIVSTNRTLHGINSGTAGNGYWDSQVIDVEGNVATEGYFQQLEDQIGAVGQAEDLKVFITTRGIRRRLADDYQSMKRYTDAKAVEIHGGYSAIWVNETPVVADDDAPKGNVFALDMSSFKLMQLGRPDWLKAQDESVWHLAQGSTVGSRRAAWEAWWMWDVALANLAPNRNGRLINAQDDS